MGKAQTLAEIIQCCVLHKPANNSNVDAVTRRFNDLVAYTSNKAMLIDGGKWLHNLDGSSWDFKVGYLGERRTKREDRLIGITCTGHAKIFFDDVIKLMQRLGVYHSHLKKDKLIMVYAQKFAKVEL